MPSFRRVSPKSNPSGNLSDISKKPSSSSDNSLPVFIHPHHLHYLPPTPTPIAAHTSHSIRKPSSHYNLKHDEDLKESNYTIESGSASSSRPHTRNNSLTNSDLIATSPTNTSQCIFSNSNTSNTATNSTSTNATSNNSSSKRPGLSHFFSSRKSRISSVSRASSPSQSEDDSSSSKDSSSHKSSFFDRSSSNHSHRHRSNSQPQIMDQSHISSYRSMSTEDETIVGTHLHTPRKSNTSPTHVTIAAPAPTVGESSTTSLPNAFKISNPSPPNSFNNPIRTNSIMSTDSSLGYRRNSSTGSTSQDTSPPSGFSNIIAGQPGAAYRKKSDVGLVLTPLTPETSGSPTANVNESRSGSFSAMSTASPKIAAGNSTTTVNTTASTTTNNSSSTTTSNNNFFPANTPEAISGDALANYYEKLASKQRDSNQSRDPSLSPNLEGNPSPAQMSPKSIPPILTTSTVHPLSLSNESISPTTSTTANTISPPSPSMNRSHSADNNSSSSSSPAPIRVPTSRTTRASGSVSPLSTSLGATTTVTGLSATTYMSKLSDHLNIDTTSSSSSVFPPRKLSQVSQVSQTSSIGSFSGSISTPKNNQKQQAASTDSVNTNKLIWDMFVKFVSNSRLSDSLIYATTRKEAWLQYSDTGFRNTHIIELWLMMALRFLFQNQLLFSPKAFSIISTSSAKCVLDIQGVFKDHWAWQLAIDYPDAMVYGLKFDPSQKSYSSPPNHEGPSNYIPFVGHSLCQLPFDDNFFDVISAKTLWYLLKADQWEDVFKELFRIIKPGGIIELLISDYVILNRGPIEQDLWDRYQEGVIGRNVDPTPSHKCASRLHDTGFEDIHRAMLGLPRAWGGQIGQLTDLLSSYYTLSLAKYFSDFQQPEIDAFKYRSKHAVELHHYEAGSLHLFYGTKPKSPP